MTVIALNISVAFNKNDGYNLKLADVEAMADGEFNGGIDYYSEVEWCSEGAAFEYALITVCKEDEEERGLYCGYSETCPPVPMSADCNFGHLWNEQDCYKYCMRSDCHLIQRRTDTICYNYIPPVLQF